jgi:hypothetical protein
MRVSIVPAQITTVEDKLAGSLSVKQGMLLGVPVLFGFLLAVVFPPSGQFVTYKIVIVAVIFIICGTLAIRIKERIIADWLVLFTAYMARPRYYVYDKNSMYLRPKDEKKIIKKEIQKESAPITPKPLDIQELASNEFTRLQTFATDRNREIKFVVGKKGELNVRITEAE